MHELMVAKSLLAAIAEEVSKHTGKPILARISCGPLHAINDASLVFAFKLIAEGTPCEGVELQIEHKPLKAVCGSCRAAVEIDLHDLRCPSCGDTDLDIEQDQPILLEAMKFQET
jgi:hydrogenase nickel incorporation protein HypA/HybF